MSALSMRGKGTLADARARSPSPRWRDGEKQDRRDVGFYSYARHNYHWRGSVQLTCQLLLTTTDLIVPSRESQRLFRRARTHATKEP